MRKRKLYELIAIGSIMLAANELSGDLRFIGLIIGALLIVVLLARYQGQSILREG